MRLREYQSKAADAVFKSFEEHSSALVVMPTGSGKSVLFSHIIDQGDWGRVVVLAHREELIYQAAAHIERATGYAPDIEMSSHYADKSMFRRNPVVVSSIQTQSRGRMERFDPNQFGLVLLDEAHHATSKSYRKVIDHYRKNPDCKLLGVTATPDRADEAALGRVFDDVAFVYELSDAIKDGWLVPIFQRPIALHGLDLSSVGASSGDLNKRELAEVLEDEELEQQVAHAVYRVVGQRKTLVFAVTVRQAEMIADILNRHEPDCARWVCGKTPKQERAQTLRDYKAGVFRFLVNVGVFTEGYDEPGIEVVVMARPTKSRALYSQMVGRGTRPLAGLVDGAGSCPERHRRIATSAKPRLEVIDFVGNSGKHKLVTTADILGGKHDEAVVDMAKRVAMEDDAPVDVSKALEEAAEEHERRKADERRRRMAVIACSNYTVGGEVDPFDVLDIAEQPARGWDRVKRPSARMVEVLERAGIGCKDVTYSQASQLIGAIMERRDKGLCTPKQAKVLAGHGYDTGSTFAEAREIIDALAANNWQRPEAVEVW